MLVKWPFYNGHNPAGQAENANQQPYWLTS